jgi:putative oxidoreductase
MLSRILKTHPGLAPTFLRLPLGLAFLAHGFQKMLGVFGGSGFSATMNMFTHRMHIPPVFAFLAIASEFFGGLGLLIGFLSRIAAFGIFVNMLVAIYLVALPYGFFINWSGKQKGEGIEFHLLAIGMTLAIMILGSGSFSVDLMLSGSGKKRGR